MKGYLKRKFGLTDSGVKAVQRAALISFLVHIGYMALMMIAMYYGDNVLRGVTKPAWYYLLIIVPTLLVLYVLVNREYVLTFNATYKESQSLRLEIADRLRDLPLSYFLSCYHKQGIISIFLVVPFQAHCYSKHFKIGSIYFLSEIS